MCVCVRALAPCDSICLYVSYYMRYLATTVITVVCVRRVALSLRVGKAISIVCVRMGVCVCVCVAAFNTAYTRWQCKLHACTPEGEGGGSQTLHTCSLTSDTHGTEVFALRIRTVATHCINCLNLPRNRMTHIHRTIQLNLSNSVWFNHISHFVAIHHDSYNPVLACAKKLLLLLLLFIYFYSTGL